MTRIARRRRRRLAAALWLALPAFAVGACRREALVPPDVAATVDGVAIEYREFESYLSANVGEGADALESDVLSGLFDQFLDERLLAHLAVERGVARRGDPPRRAVEKLLAAGATGEPEDAEIAAYYAAHRADFVRPERVHLRQILTADRPTAEKARQELERGADFAAVARRTSRDPSAAYGGDQGELSHDELPPPLADVIFRLAPGEVSEIQSADYGFHIFQVTARHPAETVPVAAAGPEIRDILRRRASDRNLTELEAEARRRYNVEVHARNLPFNYDGSYRH